jgi:gas vesicle protein
MRTMDIIGGFVSGLIVIAALSLIFAPKSTVAQVVKALGDSGANLIKAAKDYPQ